MKKQEKVILTCAITGAAHMPCMSPYLPITPKTIAEQAIAASEAGASMIHLHARDPKDGFPTTDVDIYVEFLPEIKNNCDAIINLTTGQPSRRAIIENRPELAFEDRMSAPLHFSPEVCSFNMGPINLGVWALRDKFLDKATHDWEKNFLTGTKGVTLLNTFEMMETIAKEMGDDRGTKFEYECFDVGQLYNLKFIADLGWVKAPFYIQAVLGFVGGLPATSRNLQIMQETAEHLFGDDHYFSALGTGAAQTKIVTECAILGGNIRVGLEDSLWISKGKLAKSNAEQVTKIIKILKELSIEVASPDEAREMLGTKGAENTNI